MSYFAAAVVKEAGQWSAAEVSLSGAADIEDAIDRVARTLGRFDVLATVRAFSSAQLVEVLDTVRALPGVRALDSWSHLDVVKESYASGLAVSS